jgi:hypothetical protein
MSDDRFKEENQRPFTKYAKLRPIKYAGHSSKRAPGTPVTWEALFQLILENRTETIPFRWMRQLCNKYTDEQVWEFYEHWIAGKVHDKIKL